MYVYPVEEFDRTITDDSLIKAYLNREGVERYTLEEFTEALNDDVINTDTHWVKMIDDDRDYYPISSLHIDDLIFQGFDVSKVTESNMMTIANKLSDDYCEQLFWGSLNIIAEAIGIPRKNEINDE